MTDTCRSHGTADAVLFVIGLCSAGGVLLCLSIPPVWALAAVLALVGVAVWLVRDIRGGRAM